MWSRQNSNSSVVSSGSLSSTAASHAQSVTGSLGTSGSGSSAASAAQDDDKLPPGWTKKESKSQKGRFYYVSPTGKTQWVRPQVKQPPRQYNWHIEIEVEFGEGRLGVGLREVSQVDPIPYPQFQAVVDDLPRVNGKPGPAEIYNWSVKPKRRLKIGMRVTAIDGQCLAGFTYKEVADKLKRSARPLKIKFADVDKGTIEDNPELSDEVETEKDNGDQKSSAYLQQKEMFTRVLVMSELHSEMWSIENQKLIRSMAILKQKWGVISKEFDVLNAKHFDLVKENEHLLEEKQKYEHLIKQLKLQEANSTENPEAVKANELTKRNQELTEDIARMSSGNKKLRKERVQLQHSLDELQGALSKLGKEEEGAKKDYDDDFFGIDTSSTPEEQLEVIKGRLAAVEEELSKEQRKTAKVEKEMEQLNKHLANLSGSSSSSTTSTSSSTSSNSSTKARKDDRSRTKSSRNATQSSSHDRDPAELETRIQELRRKQRSVVETMAKAAQSGDQDLAKECQRKRHKIKEELRATQDALNQLRASSDSTEGNGSRRGDNASHGKSSSSSPSKVVSMSSLAGQSPSRVMDKMPTLSGYLDKGPTEWSERGLISNMKTMRGARERWCEITSDGFLKYYKRRGDPVVRGEIDLSDKSFEVACDDLERGKEFTLCTHSQQSHFFAKSNQDLVTWVKTLRAANAYLVQHKHLETLTSKAAAADQERAGQSNGATDEDAAFYGRATLGF